MNAVEQVLDDEVSRLLDRIAGSVPDGCLESVAVRIPTLKRRLDDAEHHMAGIRASLLEGYGRWRRALEDMENLWALATWRTVAPEAASDSAVKEPGEKTASLAA